jgi:single-stranded DNA-binding protein
MSTATETKSNVVVFKSHVGTFGSSEIVVRTTSSGQKVANAVMFDNQLPEGARNITITAFGSAIATLMTMKKGDLVLVRGRYFEKPWQRGEKSGVERVLVMANRGTKILSHQGQGKPAAAAPEKKAA